MAGSRVPDVVMAGVASLKSDTPLGALVGSSIFTHVKQGTEPPYLRILGGDEVPWVVELGDDNGARQVDLLVTAVSIYTGTAEVDGIASAVMSVLLDDAAWSALDGYEQVEFVRNTALPPEDLLADGVLWFLRTVVVRVSVR